MKPYTFPAALLLFFSSCYSQPDTVRGEFATQSNGLMYSESDMKTLRFIVDSLNLRFKTCDLTKKFYSNPQTKGQAVTFRSETSDLKMIMEELGKNISYHDLLNKYAAFIHSSDSNKLIVQSGKDNFLSGSPGNGYEQIDITWGKSFNTNIISGKWIYTYDPSSTYYKFNTLYCYFFPTGFTSVPIPDKYSSLIQYVDCMIDTSAVLYLVNKGQRRNSADHSELYDKINDYINTAMKRKKSGKDDWEHNYISAKKILYAKENLKDDNYFREIIEEVADECMESKQCNDELESLIGDFVSKEKALTLKRSRRVMGMCSQDDSPRRHAFSIALLAAEAHSWDIFLRAHLDIMNDRFDRMSDGSYAWGGRKTYLKELEELNLNIVDLMLGLTLRAQNVAENHYYGTIWRMGWALTESKEKNIFEEKAIAMMKDEALDEFNRGLVFLLYQSYINRLGEKESKQKKEELKQNSNTFPSFIQASIRAIK